MTKKLTGKGGPGRGQGRKALYGARAQIVSVTVSPARRAWLRAKGATRAINEALDNAKAPK